MIDVLIFIFVPFHKRPYEFSSPLTLLIRSTCIFNPEMAITVNGVYTLIHLYLYPHHNITIKINIA